MENLFAQFKVELLLLQFFCIFITYFSVRGSILAFISNRHYVNIMLSTIPVVGYIVAFFSMIDLLLRLKASKGVCFLGHRFSSVDGLSRSYDHFSCKKCNHKVKISISSDCF